MASSIFRRLCVVALFAALPLLTRPMRAQQIALTFDDLPAHGPLPPGVTREQIITDILAALEAGETPPVYGFANGVRLQETSADAQVLDLWRRAGYPLGNHTWSHMNLNENSADAWEADTLKNEPVLATRMQQLDWHWLRFPYLAEGDTPAKRDAVRTFLHDHHYRVAGVTLSFADYAFNEPYARCMEQKNDAAVATLEAEYLKAARNNLDAGRAMSKAALGREIPFVLLMHVGAFDARMLPRLLTMYHQQGVQFVRLEQAERDPFYRNDLNPSLPAQPDTLESAVAMKHLSLPNPQPDFTALSKLCVQSPTHP